MNYSISLENTEKSQNLNQLKSKIVNKLTGFEPLKLNQLVQNNKHLITNVIPPKGTLE
jgi:hypothetical protein